MTDEIQLKYGVGALLYCPANNHSIVRQIAEQRVKPPYSVALCLEDAIGDCAVEQAEEQMIRSLAEIEQLVGTGVYVPKIFVRVRTPEHLLCVYGRLGKLYSLLTGFILPKYSTDNALAYNQAIVAINKVSDKKLYMMPILESRDVLNILTRRNALSILRQSIDRVGEYVLNVRVGGNDFCNIYGLRRPVSNSIYDIGIMNSVLSDIANVFAADYVVSAPVWEYFENDRDREDDRWLAGLRKELELDKLNGFVGKTCIHPSQIEAVNQSLQVSESDYLDAMDILGWKNAERGVAKSADGGRMNEVKCHRTWAAKTMALAMIYGVRSETYHEIHAR